MVIGLTGGIGSGKTTVLEFFKALGIPVYIADVQAKKLMHSDKSLRLSIQTLLGDAAYHQGQLNREYIANKVFQNHTLLQELNRLVHPVVYQDFQDFKKQHQTAQYIIYESAILLQSKQALYDKILLVVANTEQRIERVLKRDSFTREQILNRMNNQWSQEKMKPFADFIVENNKGLEDLKDQVQRIHQQILSHKNSFF